MIVYGKHPPTQMHWPKWMQIDQHSNDPSPPDRELISFVNKKLQSQQPINADQRQKKPPNQIKQSQSQRRSNKKETHFDHSNPLSKYNKHYQVDKNLIDI